MGKPVIDFRFQAHHHNFNIQQLKQICFSWLARKQSTKEGILREALLYPYPTNLALSPDTKKLNNNNNNNNNSCTSGIIFFFRIRCFTPTQTKWQNPLKVALHTPRRQPVLWPNTERPFLLWDRYWIATLYSLTLRDHMQSHHVKLSLKRALCGMRQDSKDNRGADSVRVWPPGVPHSACWVKLLSEAPGESLC